jgi:hypothetical protein
MNGVANDKARKGTAPAAPSTIAIVGTRSANATGLQLASRNAFTERFKIAPFFHELFFRYWIF